MAQAKLTAREVDVAYRRNEPIFLSDGGGLYLRKRDTESASWTLRYRYAGRDRWLSLGNYPDMSLAQARVEARQARVQLDQQHDPIGLRRAARAEKRQRGSFKELCEDWYRSEVVGREIKHPGVPRRYLDKYLIPKLGRTAAADVTPAEIARAIDDLKKRAAACSALMSLLSCSRRSVRRPRLVATTCSP